MFNTAISPQNPIYKYGDITAVLKHDIISGLTLIVGDGLQDFCNRFRKNEGWVSEKTIKNGLVQNNCETKQS